MNIDIQHIAKLARLRIEPEKQQKFEREMQAIVDMVEKLPDIEEELVLDPNHAMTLREDIVEENKFSRDALMRNAPQVKAGCLVVPKTVE